MAVLLHEKPEVRPLARCDYDGNLVQDVFDPAAQVAKQTQRYALFHAKDGRRTTSSNGYDFIPFRDPRSGIDYETFYRSIGAKGYHNSNYEQDNAPGGSADPGKSLRDTIVSAHGMANLRG